MLLRNRSRAWRMAWCRPAAVGGWALAILLLIGPRVMLAGEVQAEGPLHVRIDRLLALHPSGEAAETASDEEFVRRIYLDLVGTVPTVSETRSFLADSGADKRVRLIDQLLVSSRFVRHMATTFDVMLTERRRGKEVKHEEWYQYLYDSFARNKPWNRLASEILAADGTDEKIRPAAKFYLDRDGEPNLLTRDVGRMFFGMDLGCCQCHDHPLIDSYLQYDYYGLYAFLSRGTLFTAPDKRVFFAEKAEGDTRFTSVFTKKQDEMRPRLPGEFEVDEPLFLSGDEYVAPPAKDVRPVPKYSRRDRLAQLVGSGTNPSFRRNIANRLWAHMMGRGLVEPLDMHHAANPPSHPELLELLAGEVPRLGFDIRAILRELALTHAYQRSGRAPAGVTEVAEPVRAQLPVLTARSEELAKSEAQGLAAVEKAAADYDAARQAVTAILNEYSKANEAFAAAAKAAQAAGQALAEAQQRRTAKTELAAALREAIARTDAAAAKVPDAKEIPKVLELLQQRAAQVATELPEAEKGAAAAAAPAQAAQQKLADARAAAAALIDKRDTAQKKVVAAQQILAECQTRLDHDRIAAQTARLDLAAIRSLVEADGLVRGAADARRQASELAAQVQSTRQRLASLAARQQQQESGMGAAKAASEEAASRLQAARARLGVHQQASLLIAEALARLETVNQQLPQDAAIRQAMTLLKSRRDEALAETAALQKGVDEGARAVQRAAEELTAAQKVADAVRAEIEALEKGFSGEMARLAEAESQAATAEQLAQGAFTRAIDEGVKRLRIAPLDPLTPEQLAWSILTVTGMVDRQRAAAEAELAKATSAESKPAADAKPAAEAAAPGGKGTAESKAPAEPKTPAPPLTPEERERRIEQATYEKLKDPIKTFVDLFGHAAGQPQRDFFATADQALFFANGGVLQSWLAPHGENLVARLIKLHEPAAVADELYTSVLARRPSAEEVAAVTEYLSGREKDRATALQEMAWGLITSNEFRFQ